MGTFLECINQCNCIFFVQIRELIVMKEYYDNQSRGIYQDHSRLYEKHGNLVYYTDGAAFNNGYPNAVSGCGVYAGPGMTMSFRNPDDCNTNNFAELHAIRAAVDWHFENEDVPATVITD